MGWLWGDSSDTPAGSSTGSSSSSYNDSSYSSSSPGFSSSGYDSGSSSFSESSFGSSGLDSRSGMSEGGGKDAELQSFLVMEQQKAQMQSMIHKLNDVCWETCVGSPGSRLDSRTETCISNCVERFIDSSLFITNRFAQLISKSGGGMM